MSGPLVLVGAPTALGGRAVAMPEPGGLSTVTALAAVGTIAASGPVRRLGLTGISLANGDVERTLEAAVALAVAAFAPGDRPAGA